MALASPYYLDYNNTSPSMYQNTAICLKQTVDLIEIFKANGFTVAKIKATNIDESFYILLLYRQPNSSISAFRDDLARLLYSYEISVILGDFNIDAFDSTNDFLQEMLSSYKMNVAEPTHLSGGLTDHTYIKKDFLPNTNKLYTVNSIYSSDHDSVSFEIL